MVEAGLKAPGSSRPAGASRSQNSRHNAACSSYTPEDMKCRKAGIITGLRTAYGRAASSRLSAGALYGVDRLRESSARAPPGRPMWRNDEVIACARSSPTQNAARRRSRRDGQAIEATSGPAPTPMSGAVDNPAISAPSREATARHGRSPHLEVPRVYIERDPERKKPRRGGSRSWGQMVPKTAHRAFCAPGTTTRCASRDRTGRQSASAGMDLDGRTTGKEQHSHAAHFTNLGRARATHTVLWSRLLPAAFKSPGEGEAATPRSCSKRTKKSVHIGADDYASRVRSGVRLGKQMQYSAPGNLAKALL